MNKRLKRLAGNGEESHDTSLKDVLLSKYIFCENMSEQFYNSEFDVKIPAISIKDL